MAEKKYANFSARIARWRIWFQTAFLFAWLGPFSTRIHTVCGPTFHCYSCPFATFACPIGVMANFSSLHLIPFLAIGTVLLTGALIGGFLCGWICPFGFFQDLVGKIPTKKYKLPAWSGYLRYVILGVFVVWIPYELGKDHWGFICTLCPAGALEAALPSMGQAAINGDPVVWPSAVKLSIVGVLLGGMLFVQRPWCALLCPLGAIYGLTNYFSFLHLKVNKHTCTDCGLCKKTCKYGVDPRSKLDEQRCIRCLDCTKCGHVSASTVLMHNNQGKKSTASASEETLVQIDSEK